MNGGILLSLSLWDRKMDNTYEKYGLDLNVLIASAPKRTNTQTLEGIVSEHDTLYIQKK